MIRHDTNEYALALAARNGDTEALEELVEALRARLFASAYSQIQNYHDSQDAVSRAVLQICLHITDLHEPERAKAWMSTILQNEIRQVWRNRSRQGVSLDEQLLKAATPEFRQVSLRLDIQRALAQLPKDHARALRLHYLTGLSIHQIAEMLERPDGTIKRWLHLGRIQLAQEMEDYSTMRTTVAASVVHTDLDPEMVARLENLLGSAGVDEIGTVTGIASIAKPEQEAVTGATELHMCPTLQRSSLLILDEWLGGRSAFEVYALLKATPEAKHMGFCLLASQPAESTVHAAWAAGFDMFFAKEKLDTSFASCVKSWLNSRCGE